MFSIDYFNNLQKPDVILCNPDKRKIAIIETRNANLTLRFNDLSELTFEVPSHMHLSQANRHNTTELIDKEFGRLREVDSSKSTLISTLIGTETDTNGDENDQK